MGIPLGAINRTLCSPQEASIFRMYDPPPPLQFWYTFHISARIKKIFDGNAVELQKNIPPLKVENIQGRVFYILNTVDNYDMGKFYSWGFLSNALKT